MAVRPSGWRAQVRLRFSNSALSRKEDPATPAKVVNGFRTGIARLRAAIPGVRIVGATITPSPGAKGNSARPKPI